MYRQYGGTCWNYYDYTDAAYYAWLESALTGTLQQSVPSPMIGGCGQMYGGNDPVPKKGNKIAALKAVGGIIGSTAQLTSALSAPIGAITDLGVQGVHGVIGGIKNIIPFGHERTSQGYPMPMPGYGMPPGMLPGMMPPPGYPPQYGGYEVLGKAGYDGYVIGKPSMGVIQYGGCGPGVIGVRPYMGIVQAGGDIRRAAFKNFKTFLMNMAHIEHMKYVRRTGKNISFQEWYYTMGKKYIKRLAKFIYEHGPEYYAKYKKYAIRAFKAMQEIHAAQAGGGLLDAITEKASSLTHVASCDAYTNMKDCSKSPDCIWYALQDSCRAKNPTIVPYKAKSSIPPAPPLPTSGRIGSSYKSASTMSDKKYPCQAYDGKPSDCKMRSDCKWNDKKNKCETPFSKYGKQSLKFVGKQLGKEETQEAIFNVLGQGITGAAALGKAYFQSEADRKREKEREQRKRQENALAEISKSDPRAALEYAKMLAAQQPGLQQPQVSSSSPEVAALRAQLAALEQEKQAAERMKFEKKLAKQQSQIDMLSRQSMSNLPMQQTPQVPNVTVVHLDEKNLPTALAHLGIPQTKAFTVQKGGSVTDPVQAAADTAAIETFKLAKDVGVATTGDGGATPTAAQFSNTLEKVGMKPAAQIISQEGKAVGIVPSWNVHSPMIETNPEYLNLPVGSWSPLNLVRASNPLPNVPILAIAIQTPPCSRIHTTHPRRDMRNAATKKYPKGQAKKRAVTRSITDAPLKKYV